MKTPDPTSLVSPKMERLIHLAATVRLPANAAKAVLNSWLDEKARYLDDLAVGHFPRRTRA